MPNSTILTRLAAEHRMVSKLFSQLEETGPRAVQKRKDLLAQLDQALTPHMAFEEERLYPLLEAHEKSKDLALEAFEEHAQAKMLLNQLRDLDVSDDHWTAKACVLEEDISHHIKEEEGELFPLLRQLIPAKELASLGEAYQAMKEESLHNAPENRSA